MYFKDKAYYVKKVKYYLGLAFTAILFDAIVLLCFVLA